MQAFKALLSATWRYSEGRRARLLLYFFLFIVANIVLLLEPVVIGQLLNTIQTVTTIDEPLRRLSILFGLMLGIQVVFWLFHGPARVMEITNAFHARNAFGDHIFRIVTALSVQWHKDHHSGQIISRTRKASNALYDFMATGFQLIEMVMRLVGSIIAIFLLFPVAGVIAVVICLVAVGVVFLFDRILLPQYDEINEHEHFTASATHDYLTNIFTVISLRLEELTRTELWKRMTHYYPLFRRNTIIGEGKWFLATLIIAIMTVTVLAWYAISTLNSGSVILAGTVYMLYEYLQKIGGSFYTFAWKYSALIQQYANLRGTQEIFDAAPAEQSGDELPADWKKIEIRDLTFAYRDEKNRRHHLSIDNMTLERGKKVALVGESGSGKSTLMTLIRGLQQPESVNVFCDGLRLEGGLRALAKHTTLIPQEPELFSNTIEYNVSVDTDQSESELRQDLDLARFTAVLDRLPDGLQTNIAEKGVNLSGGEKQRLALARGIFAAKKSDIILLDEPTSSVDSVNELQIFRNLFAKFANRSIAASVHRLHLLTQFDYVYVLEKGVVVEHGNPRELRGGSGVLAKMWRAYDEQQENAS